METATLPGLRVRGTGAFGEAPPAAPAQTPAPAKPSGKKAARKATDPMKNFLRVLLKERAGVPEAEAIRARLNEVPPSELTFAMARTSIDALKKIPKPAAVVGTSGARKQPGDPNEYAQDCEHCGRRIEPHEGVLGKSDHGSWIVTHGGACPTAFPFPEGRYAAENAEGELRFYHAAEDGALYVMASDNEHRVPHPAVAAIVEKIAADPLAAAKLYGIEFQRCGVCGRGLTSDWRKVGIGPVCAEKMA